MPKNKPKIDWSNIKIKIVAVDKSNLNELNPYAKVSTKERDQALISICGRIWARTMKERLLKQQFKK
jgi:hypothetical protein